MITISSNNNNFYDVYDDDAVIGEIVIDSFVGEPMFEHVSSSLLSASDLWQIMNLMRSIDCSHNKSVASYS